LREQIIRNIACKQYHTVRSYICTLRGIVSGTVRIGPDTAKGYTRKNFTEAWSRYLHSPNTTEIYVTLSQPSGSADRDSVTQKTGGSGEVVSQQIDDNLRLHRYPKLFGKLD